MTVHHIQRRNFHVAKGANAGQIFLTDPLAPSKKLDFLKIAGQI